MRRFSQLVFSLCSLASFGKAEQLKLPEYSKQVLPNGVTLLTMRRPGIPLVDIDVAICGGKESEPANEPGLAGITADLLRKGTQDYTSNQFSLTLDALGGSFRIHEDEQATLLQSEFLSKDMADGVKLIGEAVLHPTFPDAEVTKVLGERRDSIKALKDNPAQAISSYANAFFFGRAHPYGRIIDEESVSRITRADVVTYHRQMYSGRNLIIAVVGDVDPASVKVQVERAFGAAPAGESYRWSNPIGLHHPGRDRILLIDKPGATQTYFHISQPGIDATNPDRVAIRLVNTLFGGRFTSMLNEELRIKTGLTYGAYNRIDTNRLPGMNSIETFTKTDSTGRALEMSVSTLNQLRTQGITAEQLASAKAYLKGTIPRELLETSDQLARMLIRLDIFRLGREEVDNLFQRIDSVTLDQANAVARKYFANTGLTFVLIGDASKIRDQLKKLSLQIQEVAITKPGFGPATGEGL